MKTRGNRTTTDQRPDLLGVSHIIPTPPFNKYGIEYSLYAYAIPGRGSHIIPTTPFNKYVTKCFLYAYAIPVGMAWTRQRMFSPAVRYPSRELLLLLVLYQHSNDVCRNVFVPPPCGHRQ